MKLTLLHGAIALLMSLVGLSPALGAFLAGVVLATSEYRHELESDIAPFKGIFLGVFFITVGASIDFGLLAENLALIAEHSPLPNEQALLLMLGRIEALGTCIVIYNLRTQDDGQLELDFDTDDTDIRLRETAQLLPWPSSGAREISIEISYFDRLKECGSHFGMPGGMRKIFVDAPVETSSV